VFSNVYSSQLRLVSESPRGLPVSTLLASGAGAAFDAKTASLLWANDLGSGGEGDTAILARAAAEKAALFDGSLYAIVPLYVTSICAEACVYCNYRSANKSVAITRLRLTDEELLLEAGHLVDAKHLRVVELVYATDPKVRIDSICRHVEQVRGLLERSGGGMVGLNAEAFDEQEYRMLRDAGISFIVLWQETYDRSRYSELHPGKTKKTDFFYRLEAYERMLAAGISNIGLGVLSGLSDWRTDWAMLIEHESYLYRRYGVTPAILGVPRLKPAAGALLQETPYIPSRGEFLAALAVHNLFSPRTMPFINTREEWTLCTEMARGGGCLFTFNCSTIPGGYSLGKKGYQFPTGSYDVNDFVGALEAAGLKPVLDWQFASAAAPMEAQFAV
jgi:2-iminoacetate synthase